MIDRMLQLIRDERFEEQCEQLGVMIMDSEGNQRDTKDIINDYVKAIRILYGCDWIGER